MRVVCDNCGASYKIPDSKLTRDVNKATCRKCGNPILIRRPDQVPAAAAGAEGDGAADERTLITSAADLERQARARPPAPVDDGSMDPRPTQVSPDNSGAEATVPRDDSMAAQPARDRDTVVQAPLPEPPPPFIPAASPFPPPPGGAPPPMPASAPPPPVPARAVPAPVAIPAPAGPAAPAAAPAYDPRGDLTFAALLGLLGVFGALIHVAAAFAGVPAIGAVGTFMGVFGSAGSALIILTGGRGVRPASVVLGGGGGFFLAVIFGIGHFLAAGGIDGMSPQSPRTNPTTPPPVVPTPPPAVVEAPKPPEVVAPAEVVPPPAEVTPPAEVAPPPAPAVVTPPPAAPPKPAETPKPVAAKPKPVEAKPAERITPKAEPKPAAKTAPKEEPAPSSSGGTLDTRVIDTMMKSNKGVKLCYIKEQKASGDLPNNVKVKMTVQPSGAVSSAKIPSGDWKGTDFDSCLSSAVKAIAFPPFEGDPLTLTYAFPNF